ncbi:MAG: histidine kinase [Firmicutes bacterium]|nr:histidine kinase [Bacillota bacterium]
MDIIKTKITDNAINMLEQININIENEAIRIDNYFDQIVNDSNIQSQIKSARFDYIDYNLKVLFDNWDKYFDKLFFRNKINNVFLISPVKGFYHYREIIYLNEDDIRNNEWYKSTVSMQGKTNWIGMKNSGSIINPNSYLFFASRAILDKKSFKSIGVISIAIEEANFRRIYSNIPNNSQFFVIDDKNRIIIASQHNTLGKQLSDFPHAISPKDPAGSYQVSNGKEAYLCIYSSSNKYGWRIVNKIPLNSIFKELTIVRDSAFIIILICITIFAFFLYIIYRNISKPLQYLINFINEIESGTEKVDLRKFSCYELLKISSGVISLVEKLEKTEKKSQKMELAKLQAQINPHFLYNTLNSIKYIALKNNQDLISELVTSLVKLLKNSISREGEFITVQDEISNVKHYINIQSIIYENKIHFSYELDSELDKYYVPNFILQPLVENCIFHGVNPNSNEGIITIRNYRIDNNLFFEVEDNGKGIDEQKMNEIINSSSNKNNFSNLGIRGIHEKLKLIYGADYSLEIKSKIDSGTTIIIKLPIQNKNK